MYVKSLKISHTNVNKKFFSTNEDIVKATTKCYLIIWHSLLT